MNHCLCISGTKLDESFPTAQLAIEGFSKPYDLDVTANNGVNLLSKLFYTGLLKKSNAFRKN